MHWSAEIKVTRNVGATCIITVPCTCYNPRISEKALNSSCRVNKKIFHNIHQVRRYSTGHSKHEGTSTTVHKNPNSWKKNQHAHQTNGKKSFNCHAPLRALQQLNFCFMWLLLTRATILSFKPTILLAPNCKAAPLFQKHSIYPCFISSICSPPQSHSPSSTLFIYPVHYVFHWFHISPPPIIPPPPPVGGDPLVRAPSRSCSSASVSDRRGGTFKFGVYKINNNNNRKQ